MTTQTRKLDSRSIQNRFLPILNWLPSYERAWLRGDILAGLTVLALLIPEGMAYAEIAGMPPQTAFYAAPIGLLLYAIFGTSRQLVVAVSAAIATMSAAAVGPLAAAGSPEYAALTAGLAILAGLISILAGLFKLGRIAAFFSESVLAGFVTGLALTIAIKQVPKLFGIEGGSGNFWERLYDILIHLDETHFLTLAMGLVSITLLFFLEHRFHKLPAALIVMVLGNCSSPACLLWRCWGWRWWARSLPGWLHPSCPDSSGSVAAAAASGLRAGAGQLCRSIRSGAQLRRQTPLRNRREPGVGRSGSS